MPLSKGTTLGPYEVTAQIGAGGMGEASEGESVVDGIDSLVRPLGRFTEIRQIQSGSLSAAQRYPTHAIGNRESIQFVLVESET